MVEQSQQQAQADNEQAKKVELATAQQNAVNSSVKNKIEIAKTIPDKTEEKQSAAEAVLNA